MKVKSITSNDTKIRDAVRQCLRLGATPKCNLSKRWYFDCGLSRHMVGNKELLTNI